MQDVLDDELVAQAQQGQAAAIGELYNRHHQIVFRYLWSRCGDRHQAEDLTGEVFTRMVRSIHSYQARGVPLRAWLFQIGRNLLIDRARREKQWQIVPLIRANEAVDPHKPPEKEAEQSLLLERVRAQLEHVDERQREVVLLRFVMGLSLQETAENLQLSVGAVKSLQHRGLHALRVALQSSVEAS